MLQKKVSVIIVSYNVQFFLELCLDSVAQATRGMDAEIIVVDNNSSDESCRLVAEKFPAVKLIANKENAGFSRANNQALTLASGEYIHYLNPDTVLPEDFYEKTILFMDQHPEIGCLGPRIIDGRGQYAPDSKKSFPSLWTSIYKITGLSAIFPKSKVFNNYYAAHIGEHETAEVAILSGCCMLVRKTAMMASGGPFDEAYFMYCEDFDLCHRLTLHGHKNYYFPETTIIHYKGESTRKLSYRYMKIFYGALRLFVKKYYPKTMGMIYIAALRVVLALRNVLNWAKHLFSLFKMFALDAILLTAVTLVIKKFWFDAVAQVQPRDNDVFIRTIPFFVAVWMLSLFLNGAYDKPFSLFRAGRGMVLGTIMVLAAYGLLPFEYRYSRGIVLFSGMTGTVMIL
ncbi:MAG: glycosyltransferase, partial [Sphingobacteriales bacterium]